MSPSPRAGPERAAFSHPGVRRVLDPATGRVSRVYASQAATQAWASKPGARWPCSTVAGHRIRADFDTGAHAGDLVDLAVDGRDAPEDLDGYELGVVLDDLRGPRGADMRPAPPRFRVVDHYGNERVMDRAERDQAIQAGRVWDWKRLPKGAGV